MSLCVMLNITTWKIFFPVSYVYVTRQFLQERADYNHGKWTSMLTFKRPPCFLRHGSGIPNWPTVDFKTRRTSHHVTWIRDRRIAFESMKTMSVNSRRITV
jgi:hypothetical protein